MSKCGDEEKPDYLVSFSIVSRRKKEEGTESLGENEERNSWKRGQATSFHRSNCLVYWIV